MYPGAPPRGQPAPNEGADQVGIRSGGLSCWLARYTRVARMWERDSEPAQKPRAYRKQSVPGDMCVQADGLVRAACRHCHVLSGGLTPGRRPGVTKTQSSLYSRDPAPRGYKNPELALVARPGAPGLQKPRARSSRATRRLGVTKTQSLLYSRHSAPRGYETEGSLCLSDPGAPPRGQPTPNEGADQVGIRSACLSCWLARYTRVARMWERDSEPA